jgi:hypothetical protein
LLTPDQILCLTLSNEALGGVSSVSADTAKAMGLIPSGKSRVQEIREQQAKAKEEAAAAERSARRKSRRERRQRKE